MAIVINGTGTIAGVSATGITTAPTNATDASKLPLAGGTLTGNLQVTSDNIAIGSVAGSGAVGNTKGLTIANSAPFVRLFDNVGSGATLGDYELYVFNSGFYIYDNIANAERMRVDSSGQVGIGKAPIRMLDIKGSGDPGIRLESASYNMDVLTLRNGNGRLDIGASGGITVLQNGNTGIGNTNPNHKLKVSGGNISIDDDYGLYWGGNSSNRIVGSLGGNYLRFYTNGSQRLTIDSAGRVGIVTTTPNLYEDEAADLVIGNNSSSTGLTIASNGTTGNIYFSTGTSGNQKYRASISYSHANERLTVGTNVGAGIFAFDADGLKFHGDTATANGLNDYEEGNWTPVIGGTSESGQSYAGQTGRYTKIGRQVFCNAYVSLSNEGSISGFLRIKGFPFGVDPTNIGACAFAYTSNWALSSGHWIEGWVYTDNLIYLYETNGSGTATQLNSDNCTNNSKIAMTFSFQTDD